VLELKSALALPLGFLGMAPSRDLSFSRSLGCAMRFFPMLRSLFALLFQPSRLAASRPVDRRCDHDYSDDNKRDYPCIH
jgi:hypothetical protein